MNAFIIDLDNRPGSLADVTAAIAEKGININGVAGATGTTTGTIAIVTNDEDATRSALQGAGARFREVARASAALEQVALHGEAIAHEVPAGRDAVGTGVRSRATLGIDHAQLANLRGLVAGQQGGDHLLGRGPGAQQLEPGRPEGHVH
jgi:hypothetical protein